MRKLLLTATSVVGLALAPAVWAQQSPGGGAGGEMERGGSKGAAGEPMTEPGGGKMRQGAGDEMSGEKGKGAERETNEKGMKGAERDRDEKGGKGAERDRDDKTKGAERERGENSGGAASLTTEQKTKVRSSFRGATIREARDINITRVSVGASVPRTVIAYWEPVPATIVAVVPAWRSYKVVRVRDDILVIDPDTYEIVYVM
jgi:hypothetical protein